MIKNSIPIVLTICSLLANCIYCQENTIPVRDESPRKVIGEIVHHVDLGAGFGLDYGGLLGFQVGYAPVKHLTLFAAGGYYLVDFGWQVGAKGLFIPKTSNHSVRPFIKAMYGSNSAIWVIDIEDYNDTYIGFTAGAGAEFRFGSKKANGFDVELNVPFRTPDYWEDYNTMKKDPRIDILQDVLPVAFSIGYHHEF